MSNTPQKEIKVFYCYAREDKALRDELEKHLSVLRRQYHLTNWHDRVIPPGENCEQRIDKYLSDADLILLLISPDFMASEYCYSNEMKRALERHYVGTCCVIPILLRPTYWEETPFSSIQMLPSDAKPVTRWPDRDESFHDVVKGISAAIKAWLVLQNHEEDKSKGKVFRIAQRRASEEENLGGRLHNSDRLQRGLRTPEDAYYQPILRALTELGGSANVNEVLERVEQFMKDTLKEVDYERLSSGPEMTRWRNTAQWARHTLVKRGLLKSNSPRGIWEITEAGHTFLKNKSR